MSDWEKTVDEAWVREIARIACLRLTEDEIAEQTVQLRQMLAALESLWEFDTCEAWKNAAVETDALREDVVERFARREELLAAAPAREGDFFRVPRALEREGEQNG